MPLVCPHSQSTVTENVNLALVGRRLPLTTRDALGRNIRGASLCLSRLCALASDSSAACGGAASPDAAGGWAELGAEPEGTPGVHGVHTPIACIPPLGRTIT